jgi:protein-S-isoprenylcysteine O-methyltransferase Ste14
VNLFWQTLRTAIIGTLVLAAMLFIPAGTLDYWQGWLFIVVFAASTNAIGVYLLLKDPVLLERRKQFGPTAEQRPAQRVITVLLVLTVLGLLVLCALDRRFGWSPVPASVSVLGDVLVALGLFIDLLVLRENTYSASNIRIAEGQKVISTGPYAIVRHPMYAGALIMMIGVPLALDSWWGLLLVAATLPVLVWRILDEEALLRDELPGYTEYTRSVRHRLVPYVW